MALRLDFTGLFASSGEGGVTPEAFQAALPRAASVKAAHEAALPEWRRLPARTELLDACRRRADEVLGQDAPDSFVVLGIGGSALGNSALMAALAPVYQEWRPPAGRPRVFVLDSVDPDWLGEFFESVDPARCHFNVISKSGGTIETSSQFLVAYDAVRRAVGGDEEARRRFTVTTDPAGGHFRELCDELGFATLPVPDGVGGRFSVLSPVGMFMAAVAGLDTEGLLAGAARVDAKLREAAPGDDPALAYALAHVLHMEQGRRIHVHFPYSHRLRLLADWYKQLWAESLGKRKGADGRELWTGPTPVKAVGPTDQHSQVQLYMEGPDDKVYTLVRLDRFGREVEVPEPFADSAAFRHLGGRKLSDLMEAERQGTEEALRRQGRPVCTLELCKLDAFHVGQYFLFFEVATAYAGGLLGIDPYDQPGVEHGKKAALALMDCAGFEELAADIRAAREAQEPVVLSC